MGVDQVFENNVNCTKILLMFFFIALFVFILRTIVAEKMLGGEMMFQI